MLRAVQVAPLVTTRGLGKFTYRDVQVATGELPPPAGAEKVEQSTIDGAFAECDAAELKATGKAVKQAVERTKALEKELGQKVGEANVPQLDAFTDLLAAMNKLLQQKLAVRGLLDDEADRSAAAEPPESADAAASSDGNGQAGGIASNGRKAGAPTSPHRRYCQPRRCNPRPRQNLRLLQTVRTVESGTVVPEPGKTARFEELFGNSARLDARRS